MPYLADLHVHSHYSRATSGDCRPGPLAAAAARKGLTVIGTGDATHAGWRAELRGALTEAEEGLYRLREAAGAAAETRFAVTGEISCIYKLDGKTRKIHHVFLLPSLAAAERFSAALEARGANLAADGRPIVGLDSRTVLELLLGAEPRALLIPAHIWTPHFSLFGALSGFDALEEAFGSMAGEIHAYETGLSSDPPMNWRLSALDRLTLVSNSDAHSPEKLGREAVEFEAELSYAGLAGALRRERGRVIGTVEFFPEEGKYHFDGHRNCGVRWHPRETLAAGGLCRVCGRPVTVGVLHRAEALADRPEGFRPPGAPGFIKLVPLAETVAAAFNSATTSRRVQETCARLLKELGPEIGILRRVELAEIDRVAGALTAEAVRRVREGEVEFLPGFDGEYGRLAIFRPEERARLAGLVSLFAALPSAGQAGGVREAVGAPAYRAAQAAAALAAEPGIDWASDPLAGLDDEQRRAAAAERGPVVVQAGPGAGKTRTLTQRIAFILGRGADPRGITAITFTHRAADELRRRLAGLGEGAARVWVGTFHRFCLEILTAARGERPLVLDEREAAALLDEVTGGAKGRRGEGLHAGARISLLKAKGIGHESPAVPAGLSETYRRYQERLAEMGACDYDDLLLETLRLLRRDDGSLAAARARAGHLLVDEFQDVNAVQYHLVRLLAGEGEGLFVIGDPDQAIYGFRGADRHYFGQLLADFPGAVSVRLCKNYRSSGAIVRAARVFSQAGDATAAHPGGQCPRRLAVGGPRAEARAVVAEIERLVGGTGMQEADRLSGRRSSRAYSLGEIAVLFRTGRQAAPIEEALLRAGIPYRLLGRRALAEDPALREALDILRYVDQPSDLRFMIALGQSRFDPGLQAMRWIRRRIQEEACPAASAAVSLLREKCFTIAVHERIQGFLDLAADLAAQAAFCTAAELLLKAAPAAGEPGRALAQVARAAEGQSLGEFLLRLSTGQEADAERREESRRGEGVTLLTMHAAKGLEFPAVILAGLAEGIVPWKEAAEGEELEEERRLFYVAMTRAAEVLVLCGPAGGEHEPSRFLAELPEELVERAGGGARKRRPEIRGLF